jgi:hypothetical protein
MVWSPRPSKTLCIALLLVDLNLYSDQYPRQPPLKNKTPWTHVLLRPSRQPSYQYRTQRKSQAHPFSSDEDPRDIAHLLVTQRPCHSHFFIKGSYLKNLLYHLLQPSLVSQEWCGGEGDLIPHPLISLLFHTSGPR